MIVGVPRETYPGERRVALVPGGVPSVAKAGLEVHVEPGAGAEAGYPDSDYQAQGAQMASGRPELLSKADVLLYVRAWVRTLKQGPPIWSCTTLARRCWDFSIRWAPRRPPVS